MNSTSDYLTRIDKQYGYIGNAVYDSYDRAVAFVTPQCKEIGYNPQAHFIPCNVARFSMQVKEGTLGAAGDTLFNIVMEAIDMNPDHDLTKFYRYCLNDFMDRYADDASTRIAEHRAKNVTTS